MSSPRTNINRLLRLADLLRELPKKAFSMAGWVAPHLSENEKATCGMTCCVGGWATCVHPDLFFRNGCLEFGNEIREVGEEAFAIAFGLDYFTAYDLTSVAAPHKTPKAAADAVEAVAADLAEEHGYDIVEVPA